MAGTRNKQTIEDYTWAKRSVQHQETWLFTTSPCVNDKPAFPVGLNAPKYPANLLSNNFIDIETSLRGIGANNYEYKTPSVTPRLLYLPQVSFYETAPLYLPQLPTLLQNQRPF